MNPPNQRGTLRHVEVRKNTPTQRKAVTITRKDLDWASSQGLLGNDQVARLWEALVERSSSDAKFNLANLAYYGGAAIVLIALGWFMFLVTAEYQATALVATSLVYALGFVGLGSYLYFQRGLRTPGGILYTLAVSVTPLFVFGLLSLGGITTLTSSHELLLETATAVAAVVALTFVRFPFLTMPLFASLWFMSLSLMGMVNSHSGIFYGNEQLVVTMIFGSIMTLVSLVIDRRTSEDFAFWGYFFGVSSAWTAYTFLDKGGQMGLFIYFTVNVLLLLVSVLLQRRVFLVLGGLGSTGYLMYLAYDIFQGSMAFPIVLSAIGIGVIFMGIWYHKNKQQFDAAILRLLPGFLRRSLPQKREG